MYVFITYTFLVCYINLYPAGPFTLLHTILSLVPSFWFEPKIIAQYGIGVIQIPSLYLAARTSSPSTVAKQLYALEGLHLSKL